VIPTAFVDIIVLAYLAALSARVVGIIVHSVRRLVLIIVVLTLVA
jgi:hypothetical protein